MGASKRLHGGMTILRQTRDGNHIPIFRDRTLLIEEWTHKPESVKCNICKSPTKGQKPVCSDHIEYMPYVQQVAEQFLILETAEQEVCLGDFTQVETIVDELVNGAKACSVGPWYAVGDLSKRLHLKPEAVRNTIMWLEEQGRASTRETRKGKTVMFHD